MSTERDALAEVIRYGRGEDASVRPSAQDQDISEAILAAGYSKPRTITTVAELDALPDGSVVLSDSYHSDVDGTAISFQRWYDGRWHRGARSGDTHPDNFLPATVLYTPEPQS
jgi:hypothetical protein